MRVHDDRLSVPNRERCDCASGKTADENTRESTGETDCESTGETNRESTRKQGCEYVGSLRLHRHRLRVLVGCKEYVWNMGQNHVPQRVLL